MKHLNALLALAVLCSACAKNDEQPSNPTTSPSNIDLSDLKAGQKDTYIAYEDACGLADGFKFTGDTLEVEVVRSNQKLFFKESFTPGSTNYSQVGDVLHEVIDNDGYLLIPERALSNLFYFYGNDTLWTQVTHDVELIQGDCFVHHENGDAFVGEEIGLISSFQLGNIAIGQHTIISCVPVFMDMDAYLLYNPKQLKLSHTLLPGMLTHSIRGFYLLE